MRINASLIYSNINKIVLEITVFKIFIIIIRSDVSEIFKFFPLINARGGILGAIIYELLVVVQ